MGCLHGDYRDDGSMITIKEIAKHLGMSATTVSNVIRGKTGEVSPETIERVQKFLEEVDYVPNINARNLAQNQSKIIGVVLKTVEERFNHILADAFVSELLGGIEKEIREAGYFMMLYISEDIAEILKYVATWNVDGLLLFWMQDDDALRIYKKYRKPVVCVDTYIKKETIDQFENSFVNIGLTDEQGTYEAVSYLTSLGHERIAFLTDELSGVDLERFHGYRRALSDAGIEYSDRYLLIFRSTKEDLEKTLSRAAEKASKMTAVFCCSDTFAALLMNECFRQGMRIPEDLSIMGFDDSFSGRLCRPALTTVHQDIAKKGELATKTLLGLIRGERPKENEVILPTELILRESVAKPAEKEILP